MINIHGPTKISIFLIWSWALFGFPWRLKLNVTRIIQPLVITTIFPIWATTITEFDHYQLEIKVNRA